MDIKEEDAVLGCIRDGGGPVVGTNMYVAVDNAENFHGVKLRQTKRKYRDFWEGQAAWHKELAAQSATPRKQRLLRVHQTKWRKADVQAWLQGENQFGVSPSEEYNRVRNVVAQLRCTDCKRVYTTCFSLHIHKRVHSGVKPFACDECGKRFVQRSNLQAHKRIHTGDQFLCDECGRGFVTRWYLKVHKKRVHSGEKPFVCEVCGETFAWTNSFRVHTFTHTGEEPFKCNECGKMFAHQSNLTRHERVHTGEKPFSCDKCENRFVCRSSLKKHERVHTGNKPFACMHCAKTFARRSTRKRHERVHTGEKPFACNICSKTFSQCSYLPAHKRVHSGEKPFACTYPACNRAFPSRSGLNAHVLHHERRASWRFVCDMADHALVKYKQGSGHVPCNVRFPTAHSLKWHKYFAHTADGRLQVRHSEDKMARFLTKAGIAFDRDWENRIDFGRCAATRSSGSTRNSARPDFFLPTFLATHGVLVVIENDERQHQAYDPNCELERLGKIVHALHAAPEYAKLSILFVRFNPHPFEVDGVQRNPKLAQRLQRLQREVLDALETIDIQEEAVNLVYMFYDAHTKQDERQDPELVFFKSNRFHAENQHAARMLAKAVVRVIV